VSISIVPRVSPRKNANQSRTKSNPNKAGVDAHQLSTDQLRLRLTNPASYYAGGSLKKKTIRSHTTLRRRQSVLCCKSRHLRVRESSGDDGGVAQRIEFQSSPSKKPGARPGLGCSS